MYIVVVAKLAALNLEKQPQFCSHSLRLSYENLFLSEAIKNTFNRAKPEHDWERLSLAVTAITGFICDLMCFLSFFSQTVPESDVSS